jgi:hypothetical protein
VPGVDSDAGRRFDAERLTHASALPPNDSRAPTCQSLGALTTGEPIHSVFLLSPANLAGERAKLVFRRTARFDLAQQLQSSEGAPLGAVYAFISGLYFRGKKAYAEAFARPPGDVCGGLVITPGEGLRSLEERVTVERLEHWAGVQVDAAETRFTAPLVRDAEAIARQHGGRVRVVLLGSVATDKYVRPLTGVFGASLLFPTDFVGRGDMSRGALLLRAAREGCELAYEPVEGARRHGPRAPSVAARARVQAGRRPAR